jgi:hypothetical protein
MSRWSRSLNLLEPQQSHQACSGKPLPFSIYAWVFQVVSFPQVSPAKTLYAPLLPPYVLHALPLTTVVLYPDLYRSYWRISLILRHHVIVRNMINVLRWEAVSSSPNPPSWRITVSACSREFHERLTRPQLLERLLYFMESKVSLPHSQQPATYPYHEQEESSPRLF